MRRLPLVLLAAALVAALAVTQAAVAVAPKKGRTYRGTLAAPRTRITVTFKVSANGRKVSALKISDMPLYCSGGGPAVPITFKPAAISKGAFRSTGKQTITAGSNAQTGATLAITGKFASHGKESGKLTIKRPNAPTCDGTSKYTTHV